MSGRQMIIQQLPLHKDYHLSDTRSPLMRPTGIEQFVVVAQVLILKGFCIYLVPTAVSGVGRAVHVRALLESTLLQRAEIDMGCS